MSEIRDRHMERYISTKDLVESLGLTVTTINNMIKDGRLPKPDISGGRGVKRLWKESTLLPFTKKNVDEPYQNNDKHTVSGSCSSAKDALSYAVEVTGQTEIEKIIITLSDEHRSMSKELKKCRVELRVIEAQSSEAQRVLDGFKALINAVLSTPK